MILCQIDRKNTAHVSSKKASTHFAYPVDTRLSRLAALKVSWQMLKRYSMRVVAIRDAHKSKIITFFIKSLRVDYRPSDCNERGSNRSAASALFPPGPTLRFLKPDWRPAYRHKQRFET